MGSYFRPIFQMTTNSEGIDLDDTLTIFRTEKCIQCIQKLQEFKVLLLRSPPCSGKSSFATLLEHHAKEIGYEKVYSISLLGFRATENNDVLDFWKSHSRFPAFDEIFQTESDQKILVVIDETQMIYKSPTSKLWEILKNHMNPSRRKNNNLLVLLLAAYGEIASNTTQDNNYAGAPITFTQTLGLEFLYFEKSEFQQLTQKFNSTKYGRTSFISGTVGDCIYNLTAGHAGLARITLQMIADVFYSHSTTAAICDDQSITAYILSSKFYNKILDVRAVPRRSNSSNPLTGTEVSVLMDVLLSPTDRIPVYPSGALNLAATQLVMSGVLSSDLNNSIGFPSPILRSIQINRLFGSEGNGRISSFEEFIRKTLALLKPSVLANSLSASNDRKLYERQFQTEFYRCAMSVLGGRHGYCSPDVGRIFGAPGYLDFYVEKWGVELVRDGDKLNEHAERFLPGGKYANIPMNNHAIINFKFSERHRVAKRLARPKVRNEWLVLYNRVDPILTVRIQGKEENMIIKLLGDEQSLN